MKDILSRLSSPVVQIQLISILVGVIIFFAPEVEETVKYVSTAVITVINIISGLNNPTDKKSF